MSEQSMSMAGWMYLKAIKAKTQHQIDQVILDLDYDKFENMDYTKNAAAVRRIEQAISLAKRRLKNAARSKTA